MWRNLWSSWSPSIMAPGHPGGPLKIETTRLVKLPGIPGIRGLGAMTHSYVYLVFQDLLLNNWPCKRATWNLTNDGKEICTRTSVMLRTKQHVENQMSIWKRMFPVPYHRQHLGAFRSGFSRHRFPFNRAVLEGPGPLRLPGACLFPP